MCTNISMRLHEPSKRPERGSSVVIPVRDPKDMGRLDALALPGGESTTIARLINTKGMRRPLEMFDGGIFATCAGMVLMAAEVDDSRFEPLGLIDMTVKRNAFGRQKESFEADLPIVGLDAPFHGYFIRAPVAERVRPCREGNGIDRGGNCGGAPGETHGICISSRARRGSETAYPVPGRSWNLILPGFSSNHTHCLSG